MSSFPPNPYNPNHHRAAANYSFNHFLVYSDRQSPVAKVVDGIYNEAQELQYFVIEFIDWEPGKQVLLPVPLAQVDLATQRLIVPSLNQQQVFRTPAYHHNPGVAAPSYPMQSYTEIPNGMPMRSLEESAPLETSLPLEGYGVTHAPIPPMNPAHPVTPPPVPPVAPVTPAPAVKHAVAPVPPSEVVPPVRQAHTPPPVVPQTPPATRPLSPTQLPAEVAQEEVIQLREERLVVDRAKQKVGEVIVRKEIETEYIQVPVQREKLIVEQVGAEPKQLAEIDLTDEDAIAYPQRREVQLPPLPEHDR
jgi:hypothetical protein